MSYNENTGFYEGFIYKIINDVNKKVYIGQTRCTIGERWSQHKCAAKKGDESSLYCDMRLFGIDKFHISVIRKYIKKNIEELKSILNLREIHYIAKYESTDILKGYNISKGGNDNTSNSKDVDVYDIYGNLIETLSSRKEVNEKYNICIHTICHLCNKGGNYRGLYVLRNKGETFDSLPIETCWNYKIYQFDINGNCVGEYFSRSDAANSVGVCINDALNHPNRLAGSYWWSTEKEFKYIGNQSYSSVDIYTVNGEFIGNFESCNCAARYLGVSGSAVNSCARGTTCSIRRKWVSRYKGESFDKYPTRAVYPKSRKINKYDIDDKYICTYDSLTLAAESVGTAKSAVPNIHGRCNGNGTTAYGFKWYYANDPNQPDKTKIVI